jgi:hypothetical protein
MKRIAVLSMVLVCMIGLVACSSLVQNLKLTKVSAEYVMRESRVQFNAKHLTQAQYDTVAHSYDAIVVAQKTTIDARLTYLADQNNLTKQAAYKAALDSLKKNKTALEQAAINLKIDIGGGVE